MDRRIAIIGMAARFPDAPDLNQFYLNLSSGKNSHKEISADRLKKCTLPEKQKYGRRGYMKDVDLFDLDLFKISKGEAITMDPHQRILLETVYEALNSSGYGVGYFRGSNTSVHIADTALNYYRLADEYVPTLYTGNGKEFLAARINRSFNLHGSVHMVDTSCSSSLVALHEACSELLLENSDLAIVGGVNLELFPFHNDAPGLGVESDYGVSRSFSADADGMAFGEMAGCLLLKPYEKAVADGDIIHATILATAVNNNGSRSASLTAPDSMAQKDVLLKSWKKAGIKANELGFIEAHGSATLLGDSIEIGGIELAIAESLGDESHHLPISSVKSNIGHCRASAGLAGLFKAILSLKYGELFPSINVENENSLLTRSKYVKLQTEKTVWESSGDKLRIAGVSSMGLSGTNCHVVIQEAPKISIADDFKGFLNQNIPVIVRADSAERVEKQVFALQHFLKINPTISIIRLAYTLALAHDDSKAKKTFYCSGADDLLNQLEHYQTESKISRVDTIDRIDELIFLFTDLDSQISEELSDYFIKANTTFAHHHDEVISETKNQKLAINQSIKTFAFQYAYYFLLKKLGIDTNRFLGTGIGKFVVDVLLDDQNLTESLPRVAEYKPQPVDNLYERVSGLIKREKQSGNIMFVDMGVGGNIFNIIRENYEDKQVKTGALNNDHSDFGFAQLIYQFSLTNTTISWKDVFEGYSHQKTEVPAFQFERERCWIRETPMIFGQSESSVVKPVLQDGSGSFIEQFVAELWAEIIEINSISVADDFFEIGGDSLKATKVIVKINERFGLRLDFEDVFDFPVLADFCDFLGQNLPVDEQIRIIWSEILKSDDLKENDDFFDIGGHSLIANQLIHVIQVQFGVAIDFEDVFNHATLKEFADLIKSKVESGDTVAFEEIPQAAIQKHYEVSPAQKRLWVLSQLEGAEVMYNEPTALVLEGDIDLGNFEKAFKLLIDRHESLRTVFVKVDGEPRQLIKSADAISFDLRMHDYTNNKADFESTVKNLAKAEALKPFDLEKGPLIRASIIKVAEQKVIFLLTLHHIISDGWSMNVLVSDILTFYNNLQNPSSKIIELPNLKIQYKDYTEWLNKRLSNSEYENSKTYWEEKFAGEIPFLNFPTDFPRSNNISSDGDSVITKINSELTAKLYKYNAQKQSTVFITILSILNTLLSRYTSQEDIIIGSPIAGRVHPSLENQIGFYINTLAFRTGLDYSKSFDELVSNVKENVLSAFKNQLYPFDRLIEGLDLARDISRNPLFDVLLVVQNTNVINREEQSLDDIKAFPYEERTTVAKNDLSFVFMEQNDELMMELEFNTNLFKKESMERLSAHFVNLLAAVIEDSSALIGEFNFLEKEEEQQILTKSYNAAELNYNEQSTFKRFENIALQYPDKVALIKEGVSFTYQQLNERANQIAHLLIKKGVEQGAVIGCLMERSEMMIPAMIGIFKAGAVFLPIDGNQPEDRLNHILSETGPAFILTVEGISRPSTEVSFINVDQIAEVESSNPDIATSSDSTAYLIYTSGSTGMPKGVQVSHANLNFTASTIHKTYQLDTLEVNLLQTANFTFDVFLNDYCRSLLTGGKMIISPALKYLEPEKLYHLIVDNQVTFWESTPAYILGFIDYIKERKLSIDSIQILIFGSDTLYREDYIEVKEYLPDHVKIYNTYGITEATIDSTSYEIPSEGSILTATIPIGKPLPGAACYILDQQLNLVPMGSVGELYIGGPGVAMGYFKDVEKTSERFIADKFSTEGNLFKSGDLARWLPDGSIEFLGRKDFQIKIRGLRIEPGEIEFQLSNFPEINECVVTAKKIKGEQILLAYYTSENELSDADLRSFLMRQVPEYMIPAAFVYLDKFPLTSNGKVDINGLEIPEIKSKDQYFAPETATEKKLVDIWAELLKLNPDRISVRKSFFELGGHSLKAVSLLNSIHKVFGVEVPLKDIFNFQDIQSIGKYIGNLEKTEFQAIGKADKKPFYQLSSAQNRMYFLNQFDKKSLAYNMPQVIKMIGEIDLSKIQSVFNQLIERHESLRTTFHFVDNQPVQKVENPFDLQLDLYTCETGEEASKISEFIRPFDLSKGPLLRVGLVNADKETKILMLDMHHIITDGVSEDILISDFMRMYAGEQLPELSLQYKDFAEWQQSEIQAIKRQQSKVFWTDLYSDLPETLTLPTDFERPLNKDNAGGVYGFKIGKKESRVIRDIAASESSTMYMTLLTIFNILLSKLGNQKDIVVGTPVAGRNHSDLDKMIGMFVNTLPIRNFVDTKLSFVELLSQVKENTLSSFDHQAYPYEQLIDDLQLARDTSRNPLFDVMFSYENFANESFEIPGLKIESFDSTHRKSKFDLSLVADDDGEHIQLAFGYAQALFKESTIIRFASYFENIISELCADMTLSIGEIQMLGEEEISYFKDDFNNTERAFSSNATIASKIAESFDRYRDRPALKGFDNQAGYNFEQLSGKTDLYTCWLLEKFGIQKGDTIGVMLNRETEIIPLIFSILKAGAVYVPIDPNHPVSRISHISQDAALKLLITRADQIDSIKDQVRTNTVTLEDFDSENIKDVSIATSQMPSPNDLAYIIYTSGSTGIPKGVMIEHRSVINRLEWMQKEYAIGEKDVLIQKTALSFDVSVWELFWWAFDGSSLYIPAPEVEKQPDLLAKCIGEQKVSVIHFVPSMLNAFTLAIGNGVDIKELSSLKTIFSSGEALKPGYVNAFKKKISNHTDIRIINLYGPTEATVDVSYFDCSSVESNVVPIGKPIDNTLLFVVNEEGMLVPSGTPGELVIGGVGLSRGYLNRPELNNEKFTQFSFLPDERFYRTGDVARLVDGQIEYLGRNDEQVKVRGFRIETGEIENAIIRSGLVKDVAVIAKSDNDDESQLISFVVPEGNFDLNQLYAKLEQNLPAYMVPAFIQPIDEMPVTKNGKANKKVLQQLELDATAREEYKAPRNAIDEKIAEIFESVLKTERIGIADNFFRIGGNSLSAITLVNYINKQLGIDISVRVIFEQQTVKGISDEIQRLNSFKGQFELGIVSDTERPLIAFLSENTKLPALYFVAPFGGILPATSIIGIIDMVQYVKETNSFYSLQPPTLMPDVLNVLEQGQEVKLDDFATDYQLDQIADRMVEEILSIHKGEPFNLGGFCSGGLLAMEIATRLRAMGKTIENMILVDPPIWVETIKRSYLQTDYSAEEVADFVARDLGWATPEMDFDYLTQQLNSREKEDWWTFAKDYLGELGVFNRDFSTTELKIAFERKFYNQLGLRYFFSGLSYKYPSIEVINTSVLASMDYYKVLKETTIQNFTGNLSLKEIPAYHHDLFKQENLSIWSSQITDLFKKTADII